jgi:hypothetical protein
MRGSGAFRTSIVPGGALAGPWVANSLWKNARAVPSLDLRFAENKSLTDAKTGASLITFTRASTGTYVGSDGLIKSATTDEARFDHNPTTGESLGLLLEEARTNLILQSENLAITWTAGAGTVITTNTWTAPNGTLTGDQFTVGSASVAPSQNVTVTASSSYTLSFYLNATLTNAAFLRLRFGTLAGSTSAYFNVSTLAFASLNGITNPVVQNVGNNTYKLSVTFTYDASSAGSRTVSIAGVTADNGTTADTGKIVAIWGMQYELGAFATSYIPTTTATVTRAADVANIAGTNFSSWYNQTEGTIYSVATATSSTSLDSTATAVGIVAFTDGTNSERIRHGAFTFSTVWVDNNTTQANLSSGTFTQNQQVNLASAFKINDFALVRDGGSVQTDATGTLPTLSQVELGRIAIGIGFFSGTIKRLTYWPTRLANPTLQAITQP